MFLDTNSHTFSGIFPRISAFRCLWLINLSTTFFCYKNSDIFVLLCTCISIETQKIKSKNQINDLFFLKIGYNWLFFSCVSYFLSPPFALSIFVSKRKKGILPIAEYEGSPRRFGHYQQDLPLHQYQYTSTTNQQHFERPPSSRKMLTSPTLFPPRPGFPKVKKTEKKNPN